MKPHNLVAMLILILCSQSWHSVRGDVLEEKHLKGKSETDISPSLETKLKTIVTDEFVSTNLRAQVYKRALKPSVLEEDEMKVTKSLHKEDTPRIGDYLDGPIDRPINTTTWKDFPCPDAASIAPCVCSFDADYNIDVDCTNVESEEQLAAVFKQEFPTKELHGFYMTTNDKLKVIGNILNGITFQYIRFGDGPFSFEQISEFFVLANKESLTDLVIYGSQMISDTFPFAVLVEMKKLNHLHLHSNLLMTWIPKITAPMVTIIDIDWGTIDTVKTGTFPIRADGMEVQLEENLIATIEPGSFYFVDENSTASNEYLRLYLANNQLQSLEAGVCLLRDGFMTFVFNNNLISSIEPGTFVLPQTTDHLSVELDLIFNQLTTIGEDIFEELFPFITTLSISGNPLLCGCDIAWLVLNPEYMAKIDPGATCADGTDLHTLDPVLYGTIC